MDYSKEKNPNWKGGISKKEFICVVCSKRFYGHHSRVAKYCSLSCKAKFQTSLTGSKSHLWLGGERKKTCSGCGVDFLWQSPKPYSAFLKQKYCSKKCADKNGLRFKGKNHPSWKGGSRERRKDKQRIWSRRVLQRDGFTCRDCGVVGGDLHAHHIKPYINFPSQRWLLRNGITLCKKCHYKTYKRTGQDEKRVNSGKTQNG